VLLLPRLSILSYQKHLKRKFKCPIESKFKYLIDDEGKAFVFWRFSQTLQLEILMLWNFHRQGCCWSVCFDWSGVIVSDINLPCVKVDLALFRKRFKKIDAWEIPF